MTNNNSSIIKLYAVWGTILTLMDLVLAITMKIGFDKTMVAASALLIVFIMFFHIRVHNTSWRLFEIDSIISTIAFSIIHVVTLLRMLDILAVSNLYIFIILVPNVVMIALGVYTNYWFKNKNNKISSKKRIHSHPIGTVIMTPAAASFYLLYRNVIKTKTDQQFITFWMILTIVVTCFFYWIYTVMLLETHDKVLKSKD